MGFPLVFILLFQTNVTPKVTLNMMPVDKVSYGKTLSQIMAIPRTASEQPPPAKPQGKALAWDWTPEGPVWFEIWHTTNYTTCDKYAVGTNIPKGFTLWTNVGFPPVPIPAGMALEGFIVRAVNEVGFSDWNR